MKLIASLIGFIQKRPFLFIIGLTLGVLFSLILWATYRANNTGFSSKSLWDWMELLIIPAVLAIGAWWLNRTEKLIERKTTEARIRTEIEIASERLSEAALQTYLDRMTDLLLNANLRGSLFLNSRDNTFYWRYQTTVLSGKGTAPPIGQQEAQPLLSICLQGGQMCVATEMRVETLF